MSDIHLNSELDAVILHVLVVLLDGLKVIENLLGHLGLAEIRHPRKPLVGLDRHDAREDRHANAGIAAAIDEIQEELVVVEQLRDYQIRT